MLCSRAYGKRFKVFLANWQYFGFFLVCGHLNCFHLWVKSISMITIDLPWSHSDRLSSFSSNSVERWREQTAMTLNSFWGEIGKKKTVFGARSLVMGTDKSMIVIDVEFTHRWKQFRRPLLRRKKRQTPVSVSFKTCPPYWAQECICRSRLISLRETLFTFSKSNFAPVFR